MPDRMPDRMATLSVLEYMSERVPEAKVVSNRLSGDCSKQSHAINVKLKCEGSKYEVRIETWPDSFMYFLNAWLTAQASSSESSALLDLIQ